MAWSYRLSPEKINQLTKFSHQASGVAFSKSESGNILLSPPPHTPLLIYSEHLFCKLRNTMCWFNILIYCEIIAMGTLVNTFITSHNCHFFSWWEHLRSTLLANLPSDLSSSPPHPSPGNYHSTLSISSAFLDSSCQWGHRVFVFLCLMFCLAWCPEVLPMLL